MTLEEESRLSFYRELTVLDEKKNIVLVQDRRNSELCVKKTLDIYSRDVYEQLASVRIEGVPAVKECVADDGKLIVVEEYVQGRSLKQVLDKSFFSDSVFPFTVIHYVSNNCEQAGIQCRMTNSL